MVDVAGDSCMDEANNAVQVNVVAGGAGGGAVTIADGADVAQGSLADAEVAGVGPASVIAILKRIRTLLAAPLAVAGTFWQLVQPVSVVDGADIAQGATADAAVITDAAGTMSAKLRGLVKWAFERMPASLGQKAMAASLPVVVASDQTAVPVSGTFWQATQPVSGAFFQATQPVSVADGSDVAEGATADAAVVTDVAGTISGKLRGLVKWAFERMPASLGQKTKAASLPVTLASDEDAVAVTGTFWQATQPVSGTVTAAQGTHDNLNTNANMQVGDADADVDNPVPVLAGGPFTAVLGIEALAASTMYQLIDLSDAVNFPHTGTTAIILKRLRLHAEKATDGIFDVWVGILYENDGTDGSARWLHCFHLEAVGNPTDSTDRFAQELEYNLGCGQSYRFHRPVCPGVGVQLRPRGERRGASQLREQRAAGQRRAAQE